jgi:hypothetical protein
MATVNQQRDAREKPKVLGKVEITDALRQLSECD